MKNVEILRVVHFSRVRTVLAIKHYCGGASHVAMPVRAIIADALRLGTSGLLLSHNHPSGDPTPSESDIVTTYRLARAAMALGIKVHDHLVIGHQRKVSFRATGLL